MQNDETSDFEGAVFDDRYVVRSELGRGGMAVVCLADDRRLNRLVAVKLPHRGLFAHRASRERFEREIRSLTRLDHKSIVKVLDVGKHGDQPYIVMQYLSGGTLASRMEGGATTRSPSEHAGWISEIAAALDYTHRSDVIHRDVKPSNVLFDDAGDAYLSDFGIAKAIGADTTQLTSTGPSPGTPLYMAPEISDDAPVGPAYDQYALGVMVYQALTGRFPHEADTGIALMLKRTRDPPRPIQELRGDLSKAVAAAVMRTLDRVPERRFATCGAFALAYQRACGSGGRNAAHPGVAEIAATTRQHLAAATRDAPSSRRARYARRAAAATLIAAGLVMGAWKLDWFRGAHEAEHVGVSAASVPPEAGGNDASLVTEDPEAASAPTKPVVAPSEPEPQDAPLPPLRIMLNSPKDGDWINQPALQVTGTVDPADVRIVRCTVNGATPQACAVQSSGAFDMVLPLPKTVAGRTIDGDYTFSIESEDGEGRLTRIVHFDQTPPSSTTVKILSDQPVRAESEHVDVDLAFSEAVDVLVARTESGERGSRFGTSATTTHVKPPTSNAADPEVATITLTASDVAGNRSDIAVPLRVYSIRARMKRFRQGNPVNEGSAGGAESKAQLDQLDRWIYSVRADELLTEDEKQSLVADDHLVQVHDGLVAACKALKSPNAESTVKGDSGTVSRDVPVDFEPLDDASLSWKPIMIDGRVRWLPSVATHKSSGIVMVLIPSGSFLMGADRNDAWASESEQPRHEVTITRAFYIGRFEVSMREWNRNPNAVSPAMPWWAPGDHEDLPVVNVGWDICNKWCHRMGVRLPTEAEWEYAARAGVSDRFPWGVREKDGSEWGNVSDLSFANSGSAGSQVAVFSFDDHYPQGCAVGRHQPNAFGLFDVIGNAWEWCMDVYDPRAYADADASTNDPVNQRPSENHGHVMRGGAWSSTPQEARLCSRGTVFPDYVVSNGAIGFRAVADIKFQGN